MISIGANRNRKAYGIKHYNIDTEDELNKIDVSREVMGTTAFVIETSQRYMLNGSQEWKKINSASNGSGSGGSGSEDIWDGGGVGDSDTPSDDEIQDGGGV